MTIHIFTMFDSNGNTYSTQDMPSKDAKALYTNAHLIYTHIRFINCNILNYMPLYMSKIIINGDYDKDFIRKNTSGIKVIYENELYDIETLPIDKFYQLKRDVMYASAVAQFPTDYLEKYVQYNQKGV